MLVYDCKQDKFEYYDVFLKAGKILNVVFLKNFEPCEDFLNLTYNTWETALNFKDDYDYICFDDSLFVHTRINFYDNSKFGKWTTGVNCVNILKKLKLAKHRRYLVVNDDGSRSTKPPLFYAFTTLGMVKLYQPSIWSPYYSDNYFATSDSPFTRARYKLNYLDFYGGEFDYIFSPVLKETNQEKLIEKLDRESLLGYCIYGNANKLKDVDYTVKIKLNRAVFLYKSKRHRPQQEYEIKSAKSSNSILIPGL